MDGGCGGDVGGAGCHAQSDAGLGVGYLISGLGYPDGGVIGEAPPPRHPTSLWRDLRVSAVVVGTIALLIVLVMLLNHI